jgi:hypothetical protein
LYLLGNPDHYTNQNFVAALTDLHRFMKFIMLCIVIYSSTLQAPGRNISFCAEGSIVRISETTLY